MLMPGYFIAANGQIPGNAEFEAASIRVNAPQAGFHLAAEEVSGGPGTPDPGMFRCSKCSLGTLIVKAYNLQPYEFPGRRSLADTSYDILAKIPAGASQEQFSAMLQNLLRDRFGLAGHFQEKSMRGYHLEVGKDGPKPGETGGPKDAGGRARSGEAHSHSGVVAFGSSASYRAGDRTMAELARVLSDQVDLPVDDETGLTGKYEISLRWTGNVVPQSGSHSHGDSYGGRDMRTMTGAVRRVTRRVPRSSKRSSSSLD